MERSKRIEAINGDFQLPEALIQHIQSFLSGKEAAKTTVLSKSWYGAWSTRPNIDFDQRQFRRNFRRDNSGFLFSDRFSEFARKTMRRYEELNLKIESFRLFLYNPEKHDSSCYLAEELILRAMKMGVSDLSIEFLIKTVKFILPHEVLGSENLVRLSMSGGKIDLGAYEKVQCSSLKSLNLSEVYAEGDIIWDIVSSFPLIEKLSVDGCECSYIDQNFHSTKRTRKLESGPINLHVFHHLTHLMLKYVKTDPLFFRDFSSRFPRLKDLYLDQCLSSKKIEIYSQTLECIRIKQIVMLRAKIDIPSLRKFTLSSGHIPSLTFGTTPTEWEADIRASCSNHLSYAWFRQFKKFITRLSSSKLSLSFYYMPNWRDNFDTPGDMRPRPAVENLTLNTSILNCSLFWDGLFWSCCPKFITISRFSKLYDMGALEGVCNRLTLLNENGRIRNKNMFGQSDLEEVNVEFFDKTVAEWRPLPWETLLDVSTLVEYDEKVRFHLRWGL